MISESMQINGLSMRFGNVQAIDNISFDVNTGSIFGFLGPNGAGKSTTLKIMAGVIKPDAGDVLVDGFSILRQPLNVKRNIGVMLEDASLFTLMTIQEHIRMAGLIYGLDQRESERRTEELLDFLGLAGSAHTAVENASYGMKKKTALGMALVHNPGILILDEPFEGLDPDSSARMKEIFADLKSKGKTILIASHLLETLEPIVDGAAIINGGKILFSSGQVTPGSLQQIYFSFVPREKQQALEWLQ
jgi:ABC-2 type transport system ATP-binding protein